MVDQASSSATDAPVLLRAGLLDYQTDRTTTANRLGRHVVQILLIYAMAQIASEALSITDLPAFQPQLWRRLWSETWLELLQSFVDVFVALACVPLLVGVILFPSRASRMWLIVGLLLLIVALAGVQMSHFASSLSEYARTVTVMEYGELGAMIYRVHFPVVFVLRAILPLLVLALVLGPLARQEESHDEDLSGRDQRRLTLLITAAACALGAMLLLQMSLSIYLTVTAPTAADNFNSRLASGWVYFHQDAYAPLIALVSLPLLALASHGLIVKHAGSSLRIVLLILIGVELTFGLTRLAADVVIFSRGFRPRGFAHQCLVEAQLLIHYIQQILLPLFLVRLLTLPKLKE